MKKGLLLVIGVTATIGLVAQAQQIRGSAKKMNLTLEHTTRNDAEDPSFYSQAHNSARHGNTPSVQMTGTQFSSSRNNLTLLVSQSNCLTANQALGAVMFTHRISADWSPAGVNSGFIQNSWTTNNGGTWDSCYTDNDGIALFRYPSGAILNGVGNTNIANAWMAIAGPYTSGAWDGYYLSGGALTSGFGHTGNAIAVDNINSFPRIDIASYNDSTVWVTGGLYANNDGTTAQAQAYRGTTLNKGTWTGSALTWTMDSIKPNFHVDGAGAVDCYTMTHLAFDAAGVNGYAVFFGVQASATTPETRTFQPIVYNTTDGGATWSAAWAPYDYSGLISGLAPIVITATDGSVKPWFSMSNGSDIVVDNNGQLHIVCAIEWGSSDSNDSLGYTWNRNDFVHYIYDVHTTGVNTWDAVLIDSLKTDATTTQSPFYDGSTPYDLDARIQASISPSRDHIFYFWADTDPAIAGGENAYPNLFGKGIDWSTGMATATKQFTLTDDAYYHYNSNLALINGSTYTIPSTNSIDRDGSHNVIGTWDHYYINDVTFDESEFTVGVNESVASFGTVGAYPNPASDVLNVNITLNNNEEVMINMYNTIGQVVSTETRNMSAGANTIQMNTSNLQAGVYFLNVTASGSTVTTKVVVE